MSVDCPRSGVDLVGACKIVAIFRTIGSYSTMSHVKLVSNSTTKACHIYDKDYCKVMTIVLWDMQFEDARAYEFFWLQLNKVTLKMEKRIQISRDLWLTVLEPISTMSAKYMAVGTQATYAWRNVSVHVCFNGPSACRERPWGTSCHDSKIDTLLCARSRRMQRLKKKRTRNITSFVLGGFHPKSQPKMEEECWMTRWLFSTSDIDNGTFYTAGKSYLNFSSQVIFILIIFTYFNINPKPLHVIYSEPHS